jgi:altronate dehydratase large subunit
MIGYRRSDGRKGIRNIVLVVYLVECAHFVAREIVSGFRDRDVQVIGFPGCYPNDYAHAVMRRLCTHPNVGAVLLVSLGCEGFDRYGLRDDIEATGRPVETVVIQESGGTKRSVARAQEWISATTQSLREVPRVEIGMNEIVIGTICGGSDGTSGITANPAIGRAFDRLIRDGATCMLTEAGELIGCDDFIANRASTPELASEVRRCLTKAAAYDRAMGHGSFAPGNAEGGLTTQEEKSMGAYAKSGSSPIAGVLRPGETPHGSGLFLLDDIPEGNPVFGYPNINDSAKLTELTACGAHLLLFSTGRGSVVGAAIAPVLKICANPETYRRLSDDMDVNAGRILTGEASLDSIGAEIYDRVTATCSGARTKSEDLGHQEFILTYKTYAPNGPSCLTPAS